MTVGAGSIVKDFDVIKDVLGCDLARFVDPFAYACLLQALKNDPATALTLLCQVLRNDSSKSAKISGYSNGRLRNRPTAESHHWGTVAVGLARGSHPRLQLWAACAAAARLTRT